MGEQTNVTDTSFEDSIETFDTDEYASDDEIESMDDDWDDGLDDEPLEENPSKKEKGFDKSQTEILDEEEEKEEEEEDDSEEDDEESDEEDQEEENEEDKEEKPKLKTVKGKIGDDAYDLPEDATVAVPVDGKNEYPSLRELMDNYSGKKKWTQEIETAKNEVKMVRHEKAEMENDKNELVGHVKQIAELVDTAIEGKGSPLAAMEYILSLTGRNLFDYNKSMVNAMFPVIEHLQDLDETGREAFWVKLENEHLKSNRSAEMARAKQSESLKENDAKLSKLMESNGVSNEQFIISKQELKEFEPDRNWTNEEIMNYTVVKPLYEIASPVVEEFKDFIEQGAIEGIIDDVVKHMRETGDHSPESIKKILSDALDIPEETAETLKEKVVKKIKKTTPKKKKSSDYEFETFDNF